MHLKKLKIAGFKSFVDVTDVRFPTDFVGVVGPNGCGKSNVIDAVRWVMGESSAKLLRGDNMADVIFNGSSARKPVGKASVEMVFDNNAGKITGSFAQFAEISVKRTVTRDGQSNYFINNTRARRRDVLDLFRGTGLGPRSYSIIEQGMVSRIVEARPEDLRVFVEEAAGTSKYKDRRRETENRIRHTRENLDRVNDIRDELAKQLRRLDRQAKAAQRYSELREQQCEINGQLLCLKLQGFEQQIIEQDRRVAQAQNNSEEILAKQRQTESQLEVLREQRLESQERVDDVQRQYYGLSSDIQQIESKINYLKDTRQRQHGEIERLDRRLQERAHQLQQDQQRLHQMQQELAELAPNEARLLEERESADQLVQSHADLLERWQTDWQTYNQAASEPKQQITVQQTRIKQIDQQTMQLRQRLQRILDGLNQHHDLLGNIDIDQLREEVAEHDLLNSAGEEQFQQLEQDLQQQRGQLQQTRDELSAVQADYNSQHARLQSLMEIQQAALAAEDNDALKWLRQFGLAGSPTLASKLQVEKDWQVAVDRLLNDLLAARVVDDNAALPSELDSELALTLLANGDVPIAPQGSLASVVSADNVDLSYWLNNVLLAEDMADALARRDDLVAGQCLILRDGTLLGRNWISSISAQSASMGVLVRDNEIKELKESVNALRDKITAFQETIEGEEDQRMALEQQLQQQRQTQQRNRVDNTALHNKLSREEVRFQETNERLRTLSEEQKEIDAELEESMLLLSEAQELLQQAELDTANFVEQEHQLEQQRQQIEQQGRSRQQALVEARNASHEFELTKQRYESAIESLSTSVERLNEDHEVLLQRIGTLRTEFDAVGDPDDGLNDELGILLEQRLTMDTSLSDVRSQHNELEQNINQLESMRNKDATAVDQARQAYDDSRLQRQEVIVRRDTLLEKITTEQIDTDAVNATLTEDMSVSVWQQQINDISQKIERIGPVNLVAIDEFAEESERKNHLDNQHADLMESLTTLESVIEKIDRETRTRFKETFDQLNQGFNDFFPQLFGGGKASLHLTSEDYLSAGVGVMARPPGKRNSTIHLLSGGEKALTAVALLFALFRLNPAPFCLLDEVDAPLDDANVERYCRTLRSLSKMSQIIVITHNKVTMEATDVLVGVTMAEPGVSRLVSVDVNAAVEMATAN